MRAGKLDRTIVLQRSLPAEGDGYGNRELAWSPIATLRAQIVQAATAEFMASYGTGAEEVVIFRTRFVEGVTLADRVVYEGTAHNLVEVKEIGRRRGLELRTRRIGP
jgi:SPP1 family predicted phage head-tail adaptor